MISDLDKETFLNLSGIIPRKKNIIVTISRSGTLYNIFTMMRRKGVLEKIIISESRPGLEEISFSKQLSRDNIKVLVGFRCSTTFYG